MTVRLKRTSPLMRLKQKARNLTGWTLHTLRNRENRSTKEINYALKRIGKEMAALGFDGDEDLRFMGEWASDYALYWPIPAVAEKCPLKIDCDPPLEYVEFSLLIGLILSASAEKHLQSTSPRRQLLGAELLISALEAVECWDSLRGIGRCRNPEAKAFQLREATEQMEKRVYSKLALSVAAKIAANAKHDKPGGSREKANEMRKQWASGKYSTRDICAEQECASLNMSFSAARKALQNTPDPV